MISIEDNLYDIQQMNYTHPNVDIRRVRLLDILRRMNKNGQRPAFTKIGKEAVENVVSLMIDKLTEHDIPVIIGFIGTGGSVVTMVLEHFWTLTAGHRLSKFQALMDAIREDQVDPFDQVRIRKIGAFYREHKTKEMRDVY